MKHQSVPLGITRKRKVFSIGFILTTDTIEWTGVWFKYVVVKEELHKERYLKFDDGWNYNYYWSKWEVRYKFKNIL